MACVLTLVLLQNGTLTAGHVGDTRLYKMRGGTLRKLTHDHSPIGEREDRGELTESEAMRHPRRNEVYREVGAEPRGPDDEGFIEVIEEPFEPDAALLLCSDGLSDALSSVAIAGIIARHAGDPTLIVEQLIDRANDESGKDNVSIIYIEGIGVRRRAEVEITRGPEAGRRAEEFRPRISRRFPARRRGRRATAYGTPSVTGSPSRRHRRHHRPHRASPSASPSRASIARDAMAAGAAIDALSVPNAGTTRPGAAAPAGRHRRVGPLPGAASPSGAAAGGGDAGARVVHHRRAARSRSSRACSSASRSRSVSHITCATC